MDPITIAVLVGVVVLILGAGLVFILIRAWLRTMAKMLKLAVYLVLFLVVAGAIGSGVVYLKYPDQVNAVLAPQAPSPTP